ncbi:MAG TPA: hypothetical protein VK644_15010 [Chitinophagaceae bacterium]|nr:hypothetical protein [Chitinophagaceae bacterium]
MNHTSSKVKVYQTSDYKIFLMVDGNRPINKKKVQRIIAEIQSGNDVLDEVPVLVKEHKSKLEVMDGQHRLEVARQLARPVHYIIHAANMTLHNVAKINSNTEKWKDADFINCYVKAGNNNYKRLDAFLKQYGIAVGTSLMLLSRGSLQADGSTGEDLLRLSFEQGTYEVKKYKEAVLIAETCKAFVEFSCWNGRNFVKAICKLVDAGKEDFKMDILVKKFKSDPKRLQAQGNWKQYMANLEEIYNIGNSKRRVIY